MLGIIIWVIILGYIIWRMDKNKKNQPGQVRQRQSGNRQPAGQAPARRSSQPAGNWQPAGQAPARRSSQPAGNWNSAGQTTPQQKQEELKRRLQERYGTGQNAQGNRQGKPKTSSVQSPGGSARQDILSRALSNANEDFGKGSYEQEERQIRTRPADLPDDCDLMRAVQDLIVMGYQPELPAQRDFLAEGEDMLNRISIK